MAADDLKNFYGRYIEAINSRQFDLVEQMVAEDVTMNDRPHKRADVLASLRSMVEAVPDWKWTVHELFTEDDRIAARLQDSGTPVKTFLGHEPTGAAVDIMEYASYRVREGQFVEMRYAARKSRKQAR